MNTARLALDSLDRFGEYTAFHFEGRDYSSTAHMAYSARLAAVLAEYGVKPGDRVAVFMPNCPEVLACFQAIWRIGAVITPVTPQLGAREVGYVLDHSEAKVVLTAPECVPKVLEATGNGGQIRSILVFGNSDFPEAENVEPLIDSAAARETLSDRADDDLAMLLYTSGTTGDPKGVMLTHLNLLSDHRAVAQFKRVEEESSTLLCLPLSHSFGVLIMNIGYIFGCRASVHRRFDAQEIVQAIERYRVTRFSVVPTMLVRLINFGGLERFDTSSLEIVNSGAASLPNEVRTEFERRYRCRVLDGYGMSESAPTATSYPAWETIRPGSVGRAIPGVEVNIQDPTGKEMPQGEQGEICIRGPNVMKGYWKDAEATKEALRGGWLHSGDVGYKDADGYVYLTDRIKDLIIKGGENISPREIEEALHAHSAVSEAVVVGVPDATYGETVVAAVVLKPGKEATQEALLEHAARRVTKFKLPSRIVFRDTLPKNPNGKIQRRLLRQELA